MAIMTGYNDPVSTEICEPTSVGKLDECPFLWKDFRDRGYVVAYGEDNPVLSTFNYARVGFLNTPTDYYTRPYWLAAYEHLNVTTRDHIDVCLGYNTVADHLFPYAFDYATLYKNNPFFGIFWSNTFSHDYFNGPTAMDDNVKDYLIDMENRGILNDSMVVFFSDHGIRFGDVRYLFTGWYEERLPYMFISLPPWFRDQHPEIVEALTFNRNRLTNPFDLHMTLKHVLELSGRAEALPPAPNCTNCHSLFKKMPARSCEEASIPNYWCACESYQEISIDDEMVRMVVNFTIDQLNNELRQQRDDNDEPLCAELTLDKVYSARRGELLIVEDDFDIYMCIFSAQPSGAKFESSVKYSNKTEEFELNGSVSRINRYEHQGDCMNNPIMRKYCYCLN